MKILALILARDGSLRLKNKNNKKIKNKSLVERSIEIAKKLKKKNIINDILISTNSKKIFNIAKKKNILTPWLRPHKLSQSNSKSSDSALHALNWYENKIEKVDGILLLQPTTPFRNLVDLVSAIKIFKKNKYKKKIISVSPLKIHQTDLFIIKKNKLNCVSKRSSKFKNCTPYVANGSFYIVPSNYLKTKKNFSLNNSIPFVINSKILSLDIDDKYDFEIAKKIKI